MKKNKSIFSGNKKMNYFYAFLFPLLISILIFLVLEMYPFGSNIFIRMDAHQQYIRFLEFFRSSIYGGNWSEFIYTFSNGFGHGGALFFAYYMSSPFNIIAVILPFLNIEIVFMIIMIIKISCLGLAFYYFLKKCTVDLGKLDYIFSTSYCFISFVILYSMNIMWLDSMIILPIALAFLKEMFETKKIKRFTLIMLLLYITNFYMAYIVCIFISILLGLHFIIEKLNGKSVIVELKLFLLSIFISVLMFGVLLFPVVFELKEYYLETLAPNEGVVLSLDLFVRKLFAFQFDSFVDMDMITRMSPYIYFGLMPLILSVIYLLFGDNTKTKKILLFPVVIIVLSFVFPELNAVWHGFEPPTGFNYRYSFLFSFVGILMAKEGMGYILDNGLTKKQLGIIILFFLLAIAGSKGEDNLIFLVLNVIFVAIYTYMLGSINRRSGILVKLSSIFVFELVLNAVILNFMVSAQLGLLTDVEHFKNEESQIISSIADESIDNEYRVLVDKDLLPSVNTPIEKGYSGVSAFNSSTNFELVEEMKKLGMHIYSDSMLIYALDSNYMLDSIFSVKYIVSDRDLSLYLKRDEAELKGKKVYLYENPYVLPMGYLAKEKVGVLNNEDIEGNQIKLVESIIGKDIDRDKLIKEIEPNSVELDGKPVMKSESGEYVLNVKQVKEKSILKIKYETDSDVMVRVGKMGEYNNVLTKQVGEHYENYKNDYNSYHYLSRNNSSVEFETDSRMWLNESIESLSLGELKGFYFNEDYLKTILKSFENLKKLELNKSNNILSVEVNLENEHNSVFTSIPYSESWKVVVNGEEIQKQKLLNGFLSFSLDEGFNDVKIIYIPRGLFIGMSSSILGVALLMIRLKKFE